MPDLCPWWLVYAFDNPFRSLFFDPRKLFGAYVSEGMKVMDLGCGRGFNTLGLARLVGSSGSVVAVDIQQQMLNMITRRARKNGFTDRISTKLATAESLGFSGEFDFACAFWMVHETGDVPGVLRQIAEALKPGGKALVAEPKIHVGEAEIEETLAAAAEAGLELVERPKVAGSVGMVFRKPAA